MDEKDPLPGAAAEFMRQMYEMQQRLPVAGLPEIRMPRRRLPTAAPVCEAVGNLRKSCVKGSETPRGRSDVCISSLILLVARIAGMWPQEMIDQVEESRRIGFGVPVGNPPDSGNAE